MKKMAVITARCMGRNTRSRLNSLKLRLKTASSMTKTKSAAKRAIPKAAYFCKGELVKITLKVKIATTKIPTLLRTLLVPIKPLISALLRLKRYIPRKNIAAIAISQKRSVR